MTDEYRAELAVRVSKWSSENYVLFRAAVRMLGLEAIFFALGFLTALIFPPENGSELIRLYFKTFDGRQLRTVIGALRIDVIFALLCGASGFLMLRAARFVMPAVSAFSIGVCIRTFWYSLIVSESAFGIETAFMLFVSCKLLQLCCLTLIAAKSEIFAYEFAPDFVMCGRAEERRVLMREQIISVLSGTGTSVILNLVYFVFMTFQKIQLN